jgi:uncharacterized protein (DUF433 family)
MVLPDTVQSINLIAMNPRIRNGRPYLIGTTVTVADVAIAKVYHNQDADGIAEWYSLTLAQVYAALAYYYEHKAELDEQIRQQIRRTEALWEKRPGNDGSILPR